MLYGRQSRSHPKLVVGNYAVDMALAYYISGEMQARRVGQQVAKYGTSSQRKLLKTILAKQSHEFCRIMQESANIECPKQTRRIA